MSETAKKYLIFFKQTLHEKIQIQIQIHRALF